MRVQASVWDVDGTGMQFVDDPEVDLGIRKVSWRCISHGMHAAQRLMFGFLMQVMHDTYTALLGMCNIRLLRCWSCTSMGA